MDKDRLMRNIRKGSRSVHRDLSFFFSGVIIIYAVSGFVMNHKRDFNSDYVVRQHEIQAPGEFPKQKDEFTKEYVESILEPIGEVRNFTKHYFPSENHMKVFLKGGSSVVIDTETGAGVYESLKKRHIISAFNRLHYNPNRWWTIFSDIFAVSLIIITITGLVIVKGRKGFVGRGGVEFAIGVIIPLLFIFIL